MAYRIQQPSHQRVIPAKASMLAVIEGDSALAAALSPVAEASGWRLRISSDPIEPAKLLKMKLNALLLGLETLGEEPWGYLERLGRTLPDLGILVCAERSTVAQRVRALRLGVR